MKVVGVYLALLALLAGSPEAAAASARSEGFELVGHDSLYARGMNAGLALHGGHAYVGNRTDGSSGHPHPGVLVVDVSSPDRPEVVGEIGRPHAGNVGETTRELRVWPEQQLLMVLGFGCESGLHRCRERPVEPTIRFFDLSDPSSPQHLSTYRPSVTPHEMFLWVDPARAQRALLFLATWTTARVPHLLVTDISGAREGRFREVIGWSVADLLTPERYERMAPSLHSVSVSESGHRAYLAYQRAGLLVLDTSELAAGVPEPRLRLVHDLADRVSWGSPGPHSAVQVPGRDLVVTTDEVYQPCPWGWMRIVDVSNEAHPEIAGEFRIEENHREFCQGVVGRFRFNSFTAHNPTVTRSLALVSWHSGGVQAIDLVDPRTPRQAGAFLPEPLGEVATEDPALSEGGNRVVMWSYPIISDGLIYVVDVRNGLYVLRYLVEHAEQLDVAFLEGNSNLHGVAPSADPTVKSGSVAGTGPSPTGDPSGNEGDRSLWPALAGIAGLLAAVAVMALLLRRRRAL